MTLRFQTAAEADVDDLDSSPVGGIRMTAGRWKGLAYQTMNVATPERVIKASYTVPAESEVDRKAMHAMTLEKSNATHGTPALFTLPRIFGALPLRAIKSIVRDETYSDELPALMTAITITALMIEAPALIPASESAIVSGDFAVLDPAESRLLSFHGISIPMKNIMPT